MFPELDQVAEIVIKAANEELVPRFAEVARTHKTDGSIVTAADIAMQDVVRRELAKRWPEYGFLGEEMKEVDQQASWDNPGNGIWCLDPLDGTSNFATGIPFFSVSLALIVGGDPVLGIVLDPMRNECFMAERGNGAWLNGARLTADIPHVPLRRSIAVVDFKRLPDDLAARLGAEPPYGSQRNFGSSALDWCWLAADRYQVYVHGGQKLWDFAAGSLIFEEAGGQAMTLGGECVYCGDFEPRSVVAALDSHTFEEWWDWISANEAP
ncbi:MAG: inositol monophosphatase family protein [Acidiferrobacterales bacterium]|nr:inositol monophosphatase family protein [Acidiferrobacterales bacterium]